jgi:hypothetical protein
VGWIVAPRLPTRRDAWKQAACIAACGAAPDLDILIGRHSAEAHSVGAAVLVACALAAVRAPLAASRARIWLVACLAWMTHPLLDALGTDHAAPYGIMAWWPLTRAYYLTGWEVFWPISRRWHEAGFLTHNLAAAARELVMLGPFAALALWWHRRRGSHGGQA